MTEKYKRKIEEAQSSDWWGDFLKEIKKKYVKNNDSEENGEDNREPEEDSGEESK